MTVEEYVASLAERPEYAIIEYLIDESSITLFVDDILPIQGELPSFIDGREVKIFKAI